MPKLQKVEAYSEWDEQRYEAYTFGNTWNGWLRPMFTWPVAKIVAKNNGGHYDQKRDLFVTVLDDGEKDEWLPVWHNGRSYYPIGAGAWIWSEYNDPTESCHNK